ncbi:hypothetical protein [Ruminococcus albus]|uniref:hypothetical protein n=1 Tax=Ruminococcus albus TaxID=1264 RepID=UPI0004644763|nr:hypothetical protein [Ruminococcus albus]
MSHYSLYAIGFENEEELEKMMSIYNESRKVKPHIDITKEEIYENAQAFYQEKCKLIEAYEKDPEKAVAEHGERVKDLYENRNIDGYLGYYKNPEDFYKHYISYRKVDRKGNVLSMSNPEAKWDYYGVEKETTIGKIKEEFRKEREKLDTSRLEYIWNVVVNGIKPEKMDPDHFMLLWGVPSKEEMLKLYKSKEEYISFHRDTFCPSYSVLLPEGWFEPGTVGSFGLSTASAEEEYEFRKNYYKEFIEPFHDDTNVFVIDCHI